MLALGRLKEASHDLLHSVDLGLGPVSICRTMQRLAPQAFAPVMQSFEPVTQALLASIAVACIASLCNLLRSRHPNVAGGWEILEDGWIWIILAIGLYAAALTGLNCFCHGERRAARRWTLEHLE